MSTETMNSAQVWTTAVRVVLPESNDEDKLPLYVDFGRRGPAEVDEASKGSKQGTSRAALLQPVGESHSDLVQSRRRISLPKGLRVSFATILNGFPASYWRQWTDIKRVRLRLVIAGAVSVMIYRSNSQGRAQRVDTVKTGGDGQEEVIYDLKLSTFADGGWYWFDLIADSDDVQLVEGEWLVAGESVRPGSLSIGITTFNRPDYCAETLQALGNASDLIGHVDRVYVVDQGNKNVKDDEGFPRAQELLGDKLRMIYQGNMGGSGGFSRGMYESVMADESTYHLVLDDDVQIEPEGIERALIFATFCRKPTIVGGMMFDLLNKSVLHTWGERLDRYQWFWGPADGYPQGVDVTTNPLRATPWMHQRLDVDYNGWWMCLIPVETLRRLGLSIPVFIKWDDAEYGLRAQRTGVSTVTLPGAAVWHMSWTDKDDTIDWQAYFHERNRILTALLYSPYPLGGRLPWNLVARDMKHAVSSEYYAQEMRILALKDILSGPDHLHETITTRLPELRAAAKEFAQSRFESDPAAFPEVDRNKPWHRGRLPKRPSAVTLLPWTFKTALKHLLPVSEDARKRPQAALPHSKASFWMLANFDSVLVSKADGTGTAWYKRDPKLFRDQVAREAVLRAQLVSKWNTLSTQYRAAAPDFTSFDTWAKTFGIAGQGEN
ncbi:glycosyltransferase [uncultured Propionibacterium sp.]|uniref:glycosyltransferase n=1 Tax=uncultured Propionibacterium sp. TaxID=218066 RepID=UPI00292DFC1B|nr:glycosyltransferase [uncultured Propionibacterium sp.]